MDNLTQEDREAAQSFAREVVHAIADGVSPFTVMAHGAESPITDAEIEYMNKLEAAASAEPWPVVRNFDYVTVGPFSFKDNGEGPEADYAFASAARSFIPKLIDDLKYLRRHVARWISVLAQEATRSIAERDEALREVDLNRQAKAAAQIRIAQLENDLAKSAGPELSASVIHLRSELAAQTRDMDELKLEIVALQRSMARHREQATPPTEATPPTDREQATASEKRRWLEQPDGEFFYAADGEPQRVTDAETLADIVAALVIDRSAVEARLSQTGHKIDELTTRYREAEYDLGKWNDWGRAMLSETMPKTDRYQTVVRTSGEDDIRKHIAGVLKVSRCATCVPQNDCFRGVGACLQKNIPSTTQRTMWAEFERARGPIADIKPGDLISVVVPTNVTVHGWDPLRVQQILALATRIGRHWRDQQGVNAAYLDELANATLIHEQTRGLLGYHTEDVLREAFRSLQNTMAADARDWASASRDAWLWGVIIGWNGEAMIEVATKHNWKPSDVERLRRFHAAIDVAIAES